MLQAATLLAMPEEEYDMTIQNAFESGVLARIRRKSYNSQFYQAYPDSSSVTCEFIDNCPTQAVRNLLKVLT